MIINNFENLSTNIGTLLSESSNSASVALDELSPLEIVILMNEQDKLVTQAIEAKMPKIAEAIEYATLALQNGGRIIYIGAGTSGRLGVLDASECPPTFGVNSNRVIGIIAGGRDAMFKAQEGCEDDARGGEIDLQDAALTEDDLVVGLAASGRTPYVLGALAYANKVGAKTIAVTCNDNSPMQNEANLTIAAIVGPEILTGSTRLKSGSAQKMILNMISTGAMVRIGKCYKNHMVDLKASNEKLKARALKLVCDLTPTDHQSAFDTLVAANWQVKTSILMIKANVDVFKAKQLLEDNRGSISSALECLV